MQPSPTTPGYHGFYLRIDATQRSAVRVGIPRAVLRDYVGGVGLGTWLLLRETPGVDRVAEGDPPGPPKSVSPLDALSPESPLCFAFSPLVGSPLTTSAKFAVVSKSPLTERINDSLSSSHFAIAGKQTGCDAIVVVGRAERPAILVVDGDGVRFEDAGDVWGRTIPDAAACLKDRLGSGYRTAVIGPAGENLVPFATISHDNRHAGRGGAGAVMGSKNLKAIAVRGGRRTTFAHPHELVEYSRRISELSFGPATAKYRELGTVSNLLVFNRLGTLPTRNFQAGAFEEAVALAPETLAATHSRTRQSCAACTIGCEHLFELAGEDGSQGGGVRMEYESLFSLGPMCGVSNPDAVLAASRICDEQGLDTISAGGALAFAMECNERGLLDAGDLRFGNAQAMLSGLHDIAARRGLGRLLSQGVRTAAAEIGGVAEDFAIHVKGLELPGYEPRALQTMALGFAVGTRGADHNRSGAYQADYSERVDRLNPGNAAVACAIETENEAALMDSLILCKFLRGVFDDRLAAMAEMLQLVAGWDCDAEELTQTAERIVAARKWYNITQGWTPAEDTLPRRFFSEELPDGASAGALLNERRLQEMVAAYNVFRGWTPEGWLSSPAL